MVSLPLEKIKDMKVYHAFTVEKMYQIKKHGLIPSIVDGFVYGCDNPEDALEWILDREYRRRGKQYRQLGLAIFDADVQESFDHASDFNKRAFVVSNEIHPSQLELFTIIVTKDDFTWIPEVNRVPYQKAGDSVRYKIFKESIFNQQYYDDNGNIKVGSPIKNIKEEQLEDLYFHLKKKNQKIRNHFLVGNE